MSVTMQSVVDLARIPLNDSDKDRYTDAELLTFGIQVLLAAFRRRPDIFFGKCSSSEVTPLHNNTLTLAENYPVHGEYQQVIADYITARAESIDDEHVTSGRAASFYALFGGF